MRDDSNSVNGASSHYVENTSIKQMELKDITSSNEFRSLQQRDQSLQALFDLVETPPYPVSRSFFHAG